LPNVFNSTRLREARERQGFCQVTLSRASGIAVTSISAWENGHYKPSARMLRVLAETLDRSPEWFYGGNVVEPTAVPANGHSVLSIEMLQAALQGLTIEVTTTIKVVE